MPAPVAGEYWLVHPTDENLNVKLSNVITDDFSEEYEQTVLLVINKGRKVDYGQRWGYTGTLTAQVWDEPGRTAREARLALELLKATQVSVVLWTPFGDQWVVTMGTAQIGRMAGVGDREFHTLTLDYQEVANVPPEP